mgnify:CR=1 FL=1
MKVRKSYIFAVVCVAVFFSCGILPRVAVPQETAVPRVEDYAGHEADFYYTEGYKAANILRDKEQAMGYFKKSIEADPGYSPAYYQMAELMLGSDRPAALSYSRMAVAADTSNLTYRSQLARMMIMNEEYDEALDEYSVLLREDSHNPVNYSMLAALYEYNNQPFTAISILDSAELKLGRIEELSAYKRQLLINVRLYDKAVEESNALIADYPYDETNYMVLGDLYAVMNKDSLALANYREALRIDSTNVSNLLGVAAYYKKKGNDRSYLSILRRVFESDDLPVEDKIRMFEEVTMSLDYYRNNYFAISNLASTLLVKHPESYDILDLYATHLLRSGETLAGLELFKSYSASNPDSLPPYFAILDIEAYLQRPDSVTKYSDIAIKRFPANQELYLRKGFALDNMGKADDALKIYKEAFRRAESDSARSVVMGIIGDTYHKAGDYKRSFKSYDKALRYDPDNNVVLNNYAYYLSEMDRDLEKALVMSDRSNVLSPSNATYLDTQAWIYYRLGRYEEAKKLMQQAVSLDRSGSEVLLLHYGDILYQLGEYFMARVYWKRALEKGYPSADIEERLSWPEK